MTEVAGEVCDGLLAHGFTTEAYLREVTLPALERGLSKAGKQRSDIEISCPTFVITGTNEEEFRAADKGVRQQIAFYGSTPAYKGVLEKHGWSELQPELNRLSKQGEWVQMGTLISDDVVDAFAVRGEPEEIPKLILARYGDVIDRVTFYTPYKSDPDRWKAVLAGFKSGV
jgi:probable F420-dependent oxidoreductase